MRYMKMKRVITNFTPQFFQRTNNPGQWVGALMLRAPIRNEN